MELNDLGKIVETEWLKSPELRPDMNLELFEYVVMPNHFHGIIYIDDNQYNTAALGNQRDRDAMHRVSTAGNTIEIPYSIKKTNSDLSQKTLHLSFGGLNQQ